MLIKTVLAAAALAVVTPAQATIIDTTGLIQITPANITVVADFLFNNGLPAQVIFAEQQGVTLGSALTTDTGIIAAGTTVNSYFVGLNTFNCCDNLSANTSATFDGPILGIVYQEDVFGVLSPNYALTNFLGLPSLNYGSVQNCLYCGFEIFGNQQGGFFDNISVNGNTVNFYNHYSTPGDFARIITAPVPGPIVGGGLPALLSVVALWWYGRRREQRQWVI